MPFASHFLPARRVILKALGLATGGIPLCQSNIEYIIILHPTPSRKRDYGCCFLYCHPLQPSNKTKMKHFAGVSCGGCLLLLLSALCLLTRSSTGAAAMVVPVSSIHERRSTETVIGDASLSLEDSDRQLEDGQITVMPTGTMGPTGASTQDSDPYREGTRVFKEDGSMFGFIIEFDEKTTMFVVEYEDGERENFLLNSPDLDKMIDAAKSYEAYTVGTRVFREQDQAYGKIIYFDKWVYTIKWDETGSIEKIYSISHAIDLVEAAESAKERGIVPLPPKEDDGGSGGLKIFGILVLVMASLVLMYAIKRRRVSVDDKRIRRAELIAQQYQDRNRNLYEHDTELSEMA